MTAIPSITDQNGTSSQKTGGRLWKTPFDHRDGAATLTTSPTSILALASLATAQKLSPPLRCLTGLSTFALRDVQDRQGPASGRLDSNVSNTKAQQEHGRGQGPTPASLSSGGITKGKDGVVATNSSSSSIAKPYSKHSSHPSTTPRGKTKDEGYHR